MTAATLSGTNTPSRETPWQLVKSRDAFSTARNARQIHFLQLVAQHTHSYGSRVTGNYAGVDKWPKWAQNCCSIVILKTIAPLPPGSENKTQQLKEASKFLALKGIILSVLCDWIEMRTHWSGRGGTEDTLKDLLQQMAMFLSASPTSAITLHPNKKEAGSNKTLFFWKN